MKNFYLLQNIIVNLDQVRSEFLSILECKSYHITSDHDAMLKLNRCKEPIKKLRVDLSRVNTGQLFDYYTQYILSKFLETTKIIFDQIELESIPQAADDIIRGQLKEMVTDLNCILPTISDIKNRQLSNTDIALELDEIAEKLADLIAESFIDSIQTVSNPILEELKNIELYLSIIEKAEYFKTLSGNYFDLIEEINRNLGKTQAALLSLKKFNEESFYTNFQKLIDDLLMLREDLYNDEIDTKMSKNNFSEKSLESLKGKIDFAIITIKVEEFEAILEKFPTEDIKEGAREYNFSRVKIDKQEEYWIATVACIEAGKGEALDITRDIIEDLDPQWLLLVGIGGGVPDHEYSLGDVILASKFVDFSVRAAIEGNSEKYYSGGAPMAKIIQIKLANLPAKKLQLGEWNSESSIRVPKGIIDFKDSRFYGNDSWKSKVRNSLERNFSINRPPRFRVGSVASGDVLAKDTKLVSQWQESAKDIMTIEMELNGVYKAARRTKKEYPILAIRGISDIVGYKRDPEWTEYACHSAASFARAFLNIEPITPTDKL